MCTSLTRAMCSPSNLHSTFSAPQEPMAHSNLGLRLYSASRFLAALSLVLSPVEDLGRVRLKDGMLERPCMAVPKAELNAVLLGPGEDNGVPAGVTAKGVGADMFGQGKPPVRWWSGGNGSRRRCGKRADHTGSNGDQRGDPGGQRRLGLTLHDEALCSTRLAPDVAGGDDRGVDQMRGEGELLRGIVGSIEPESQRRSLAGSQMLLTTSLR